MNDSDVEENYEEPSLQYILEYMKMNNLTYYEEWEKQRRVNNYPKHVIIVILYSLIFFVSLFGNSLVCYIIFSKRQMRTVTNYYIANLSFSDLMMTLINIPFNTARLLLDDWPFGQTLCKGLPFIQACSVYVSTLTMCVIGLDRHQAIIHPFGKRLSDILPVKVIIPMMWIVASLFSLPHTYFNELVTIVTLVRCRMEFPEPQSLYRKILTVLTFTSQYLIPLSIATISYCKIALHIHRRGIIGNSTQQQIDHNLRSNRKTIKMLLLVLVVFSICWLPINLYHILADFAPDLHPHNFILYIAVHWLAMSSVCYNPFIYSVRNMYFREGVKNIFYFLVCKCDKLEKNNSRTNQDYSNTRMSFLNRRGQCQGNGSQSGEQTIDKPMEMNQTNQLQLISDKKSTKSCKFLKFFKHKSENQSTVV